MTVQFVSEPVLKNTEDMKKNISNLDSKVVESYYDTKIENRVIAWGKRNWLSILIWIFLIITNIFQYFKHHEFGNVINKIFINSEGRFEWAGVTALGAMGTLLSTIVLTIYKNRSDLVSKSRIEWLNNVKSLTSEYLSDCNMLPILAERKNQVGVSEKEVVEKEYREVYSRFAKNANLLLLNYSNNLDNAKIIECIEDCREYVQDWIHLYEKGILGIKFIGIPIKNLRVNSRDYFKREWKQAKRGR